MVIPLLAHSGFTQAVNGLLRGQINNFKDHLVPFHLPSTQVVAGKTESVKDVLDNHLHMQKSWSWTTFPTCSCGQLCADHPDLLVAHGHVASPARLLKVSRRFRQILRFSAATLRHHYSFTNQLPPILYNNGSEGTLSTTLMQMSGTSLLHCNGSYMFNQLGQLVRRRT